MAEQYLDRDVVVIQRDVEGASLLTHPPAKCNQHCGSISRIRRLSDNNTGPTQMLQKQRDRRHLVYRLIVTKLTVPSPEVTSEALDRAVVPLCNAYPLSVRPMSEVLRGPKVSSRFNIGVTRMKEFVTKTIEERTV